MFYRAIILAALAVCVSPKIGMAQAGAGQSAAGAQATPSASPAQERLLKSTESFVRVLFGWGSDVKVSLGPLAPSASPDYYTVPVSVILDGQKEAGQVYVSKDGKTLLRGEIFDMGTDPFAANRAKIHVDGSPTKGPADASVTLVEFSDFECPHCRALWSAMKAVEARYPQIRIVYKDFPLTNIHPWAQTAALGGRCAFEQSPAAFWKVEDSIFDNQDALTPENVWDKLVEFATGAGLNADAFKACLASPEAAKAVDASHAEGVALGVDSTPTVYINGRPVVGGDENTLVQYINFELAAAKK
ncbi:MAG TPA: thioredoxin domain-containing protein [Candidatus Acidoferrales bacterium]